MMLREMDLFDEVFTHVADGTGVQTSYNVTALYKHIEAHPDAAERVTVPLDEEHALYCLNQRGVEADRIKVLIDNPSYTLKPVLFVQMDDGSHLLVDGTHRYVVLFAAKLPQIRAYIVPWAVAAPYVIEDMPVTDKDLLMSWSGLTAVRKWQQTMN